MSPAHPRRCGADGLSTSTAWGVPGSSPQVRGRYQTAIEAAVWWWLIPAGAGQMKNYAMLLVMALAHPRRCGADFPVCRLARRERGSSPQVRGRSRWRRRCATCWGLIPAGAGQIRYSHRPPRQARAHPRRCGADAVEAAAVQKAPGSSPQVRGRYLVCDFFNVVFGLIPAGAGQMACPAGRAPTAWAHPRRCGADEGEFAGGDLAAGSSPQVRGRSS